MNAGATTLAFDNPGTGECPVALDENADEVIRGIASYARSIGDGRVAHFGMSFGGNFSSMSGLAGIADCAVDLGGPVVDSFAPEHAANLPYGMHDILGNAMHYDQSLTLEELSRGLQKLSRRTPAAGFTDVGDQRRRRLLRPEIPHPGIRGPSRHRGSPDTGDRPRRDEQGGAGGAGHHWLAAESIEARIDPRANSQAGQTTNHIAQEHVARLLYCYPA
jgi:hypothetical protein